MSNALMFELSEERRWNKHGTETRGVWHVARCPAFDLEVRGVTGSVIGNLARKLLAEKKIDPNTPVEVRRDGTLCFHPKPVSWWAGIAVSEGARQAKFAKWAPFGGFGKPTEKE